MYVFGSPNYLACPDCGQILGRDQVDDHLCDRDRWVDFQLVLAGPAIALFEIHFWLWEHTNEGRFARYLASRDREQVAGV